MTLRRPTKNHFFTPTLSQKVIDHISVFKDRHKNDTLPADLMS
jgi:hypothetical protein